MPESIRVRFGKRVRELRLAAGLAQEELASRANLSRHYLNEIEMGKRNPSLEVIERLANGLNQPLPHLVGM